MSDATRFFVPVTTSSFAAQLAAMGIAKWLERAGTDPNGDPPEVRIGHWGRSIMVSTPMAISPEIITADHYQRPLPRWILTAKNGPAPKIADVLDYEAEKQHNSDYYARLALYRKQGVNVRTLPPDERNTLAELAPHREWPVAALVNQMGALNAYNKAITRWAACREIYPALVALIWRMCSGQAGAIEAAQRQWESLAKDHGLEKSPYLSATQAVNPEQGKGANRAKSDGLSIGGQESFWLLEYFKFAGLYHAALPRTVQGRKDRKTYVVLPSREGVALDWHTTVFTAFQQEFWASTAIKMDIQAALRYTAAMLDQWEAARHSTGRRRRASDFVEGFAVASFKDLGSALAVMNVATIGLPDWVDWPRTVEQAREWKGVVEEHQRLIGALDEKKSEEEQLLRNYRDFLSSRDPALDAFFAFTTGYAGHAIRKMSKRQPVRRLTTDNLEVIVMAQEEHRPRKLKPIIDNPGFRSIAAAIRQSTVTQQFFKAQRDDNTYDVRYGLADELHRRSRDDADFMRALAKFLQEYSQENARVMERELKKGNKNYPKRNPVSGNDIAQVTALVDDYGAPTVASLLIAFGYARDAHTPDSDVPDAQGEDATSEQVATEDDDDQDVF